MSPAKKATSGRSGASSKATKTTSAAAKKAAASGSGAKKAGTKAARQTQQGGRGAATTGARKTTKKTAAKKSAAATASAKKAKKTTARKPSGTRASAKQTQTKKTTPAKTAAKKPAANKTAAKKTPARKTATGTKAGGPGGSKKPSAARVERRTAPKPVTRTAPAAPPKKKVRPAKFTPEQLAKIKENLEAKRIELEGRERELDEASFDATQSDLTGEVGLDEDFADAGTATFDRERDLSIRNNIRDLIDQVTRASRRIDEGSYGTCERCGQPIDATRLRELPHASLCLDCKRREERAR